MRYNYGWCARSVLYYLLCIICHGKVCERTQRENTWSSPPWKLILSLKKGETHSVLCWWHITKFRPNFECIWEDLYVKHKIVLYTWMYFCFAYPSKDLYQRMSSHRWETDEYFREVWKCYFQFSIKVWCKYPVPIHSVEFWIVFINGVVRGNGSRQRCS